MAEELRVLTSEEYLVQFPEGKIREAAYKEACEIRKFEIELYWKRAAYFWVFIGASFVGFFSFLNSNHERGLVLISCLGLVFSVAWHCVNKGSKYWQENWENHVELLEDKITGPIYKTLVYRPNPSDFFTAPKPFSVSKINQIVSTYIAVIWLLLLGYSLMPIGFSYDPDYEKATLVVFSLVTCSSFWWAGMSHLKSHTPEAGLRKAGIYKRT